MVKRPLRTTTTKEKSEHHGNIGAVDGVRKCADYVDNADGDEDADEVDAGDKIGWRQ